jgi:CelD/BcsL family acetyltransferase involved in cellulose biosynthesis
MSDLWLSVVTDAHQFSALREEWNDLVQRDDHATVFQTWEFQHYAWSMVQDTVDLCLVLVRDHNENLLGCAPLGTRALRIGPLSIRLLGFSALKYCDYNDFVLQTDRMPDVLAALAAWFRENLHRWDVAQFRPVREDARLLCRDLFLERTERPFHVEQYQVAPFLRLQTDWLGLQDGLDGKSARRMRRRVGRLFRECPSTFKGITHGQELHDAVNQLMDLHQKRMREKRQLGRFPDSKTRQGFRTLVKAMSAQGLARVETISSDKAMIAAHCILRFRGTVFGLLSGFDPDYARFSPGSVLVDLAISHALKEGESEFDFLVGGEPYKYFWASGERRIHQIEFLTGSWRRILYRSWNQLRARLVGFEWLRTLYMVLHRTSATTAGVHQDRTV